MAGPSRTRRRRRAWLGSLLVLASTTSAVSLNDLQPVQDGVLPMACSLVYHTAIQSCTTADFTKGQSCSLSCIAGIKQIENNVDDQCQDVDADTDSLELLHDAQRGSLILQLCVGNDFTLASTTSTSSLIRQTSTTPVLTTSQTIGSFSTVPFPTTTPLQTTTVQTTSLQSTISQTTFTFVPPSSSSTLALTTSTIALTTSTPALTTSLLSTTKPESVSQASTSTTTAVTSASTSTSQDGDGRGSGSPFDTTSGSSKLAMHWALCLAMSAAFANLYL